MTYVEFAKKHNITLSCKRANKNPHMEGFRADHYRCTLKMGKKRMTIPFSMGYGHGGKLPEVEEVLNSLAAECSGYENAGGPHDWLDEYEGMSTKVYHSIERQAEKLRALIGDDVYEELLYKCEE